MLCLASASASSLHAVKGLSVDRAGMGRSGRVG